MPWVRLDDQFAEHPKVVKAGPLAMAMHVAALCYSSRNLTDGQVPRSVAKKLLDLDGLAFVTSQSGRDAEWSDVVADLIDAGMWTETDDGYEIHDYLEFQPSRREVEEKRADLHAKRSAAGRKGAKRRWQSAEPETPGQNGKDGKPDSKSEANPKQDDGPVPDPVPLTPLPSVEVADESLVLDEERSDPETGLEVWVDSEGKQRQRIDGLWDAAVEIWGTPKTKQEHGRRNKEIKALRDARVSPELLQPLFAKASSRWNNRAQLNGILTNLGDLLEGIDVTPQDVKQYHAAMQRARRRKEITG